MAGDVIGTAYVEVHARVDNFSRELNAELDRAFTGVNEHAARSAKGIGRAFGNVEVDNKDFLRKAFTPDPELFSVLRRPFERALSTPIGLAVAGALSQALVLSIPAALSLGLGGGLIAVAAFALRGSEVLKKHLSAAGTAISDSLARAAKPLERPFAEAIDSFAAAIVGLEPQLSKLFASFAESGAIQAFVDGMIGFVEAVLPSLQDAMPAIVASFEALGAALPGLGKVLGEFISGLTSNPEAVRAITTALVVFAEVVIKVVQAVVFFTGLVPTLFGQVFGTLRAGLTLTGEAFASTWASIRNVVTVAIVAIRSVVTSGMAAARRVVTTVLAAIRGVFSSTWAAARGIVAAAVAAILGALGALGSLPGRFAAWFGGALTAARGRLNSLVATVAAVPRRIAGALGGLGGLLFSAGAAIIQGLINGIRSAAGSVASAARGVVEGAISAARGALGIGSPSKVFAEIGRNVTQGLVAGIGEGERAAASAADRLARSLTGAGGGPAGSAAGSGVSPAALLGAGGGIHVENLHVSPLSGRFSLSEVMQEVWLAAVH